MPTAEMRFVGGHLYAELGDEEWLIDTGAPSSFGEPSAVSIGREEFLVENNFMGMDAAKLREFVGHPTAGIIGVDILNQFDVVFDSEGGRGRKVSFHSSEMQINGDVVAIADSVLGVPIVEAVISGQPKRLVFDTGAQLSYYEGHDLSDFPEAGSVQDFHAAIGTFETATYRVEMTVGSRQQEFRCGSLPEDLSPLMKMMKTEGIIGNELMAFRKIGYFPRRKQLVLG